MVKIHPHYTNDIYEEGAIFKASQLNSVIFVGNCVIHSPRRIQKLQTKNNYFTKTKDCVVRTFRNFSNNFSRNEIEYSPIYPK